MIKWLEEELENSENNNEFIYIVIHFPLNAYFMLTECTKS